MARPPRIDAQPSRIFVAASFRGRVVGVGDDCLLRYVVFSDYNVGRAYPVPRVYRAPGMAPRYFSSAALALP